MCVTLEYGEFFPNVTYIALQEGRKKFSAVISVISPHPSFVTFLEAALVHVYYIYCTLRHVHQALYSAHVMMMMYVMCFDESSNFLGDEEKFHKMLFRDERIHSSIHTHYMDRVRLKN